MSLQAAKLDLESLTESQEEFHVVKDPKQEIISNFYRVFLPCTWHTTIPMTLKCSQDGDEVVYTVNNSFHLLIYTYMRFVLPPIKVKDEYKGKVKVAWCHNVGTNIIKKAAFKEDDVDYQEFDNVWNDIYFQFYQKSGAGKRENHNIGIGNVNYLETFSDFLPSYPINVEQPWFYGEEPSLSYPIFYKGAATRAEHRYVFRRKITDLLRLKVCDKSGKWKDIPNDESRTYSKYLDISNSATIKTPELWGRYALISDSEIEFFKCKQERHFYIRNVEICDSTEPKDYNSVGDISLFCKNPCLAYFWVAENQKALSINNFSNYTTNVTDIYKGWDPIKTTTVLYGTTPRLNNLPSDHFSIAEPRKHFPSSPCEIGYHGYSYSNDSSNFHAEIGIVFSNLKVKLQCKIENNDIFSVYGYEKDEDDNDEDVVKIEENEQDTKKRDKTNETDFILRARLLVVRKFTVKLDGTKVIYSVI